MISRDITERKKAQEKLKKSEEQLRFLNKLLERRVEERTKELRESEEKYRTITENSLMGIAILQDNVFIYVNHQYEKIYGYSAEELKNWEPGEYIKLFHPIDREFGIEQSRKSQIGLKDAVPYYQFQGIKKSGETIWIEILSRTISYRGKLANLITILDITEKKEAENKLKESEAKFRTAFNNSALSMSITTVEKGRIIEANDVCLSDLGFKREEIIGKTTKELNLSKFTF